MLFSQYVKLENKRVKLLPLDGSEEVFSGLEKIAYDTNIWQFTTSMVTHKPALEGYVYQALAAKENKQRYPFVIIDKRNMQIAGSSSYGSYVPAHGRIEIGWTWLGKAYQRTGLNRACKFLLISYAFEQLNLARVEFKTDVLNNQSRTALKGIGATEEGILRSHTCMHDGRRRDTIFYSILHTEWPEIRKRIFPDFL